MTAATIDVGDLTWPQAAFTVSHAVIYDCGVKPGTAKAVIGLGNDSGIEMYLVITGGRRRRWRRAHLHRKQFHPHRRTRMAGK